MLFIDHLKRKGGCNRILALWIARVTRILAPCAAPSTYSGHTLAQRLDGQPVARITMTSPGDCLKHGHGSTTRAGLLQICRVLSTSTLIRTGPDAAACGCLHVHVVNFRVLNPADTGIPACRQCDLYGVGRASVSVAHQHHNLNFPSSRLISRPCAGAAVPGKSVQVDTICSPTSTPTAIPAARWTPSTSRSTLPLHPAIKGTPTTMRMTVAGVLMDPPQRAQGMTTSR